MEMDLPAPPMQDGTFEVVVEDGAGHSPKELKGGKVPAKEGDPIAAHEKTEEEHA